MTTNATITPAKLIPALHAFIAQRSGIDYRNYGGSREAYMSDYRPMLQAGKDARAMLTYIERSWTVSPEMWRHALHGTRFDWNDATGTLDYTTGQYFVVEYRAAVCRLLASVLRERSRDVGGRFDAAKLHDFATREFGRGVANRWFAV